MEKKRKKTIEIRNEMKKVAQSSNTSLRDISQVFGANWFQDISYTYHCGRNLANLIDIYLAKINRKINCTKCFD